MITNPHVSVEEAMQGFVCRSCNEAEIRCPHYGNPAHAVGTAVKCSNDKCNQVYILGWEDYTPQERILN